MIHIKVSHLIFFFSGLLACTSKKAQPISSFKTIISDTTATHQPSREIEFSKTNSDLLNLPYIFEGVDSFELKVWTFSMLTPEDHFVLRYVGNKWIAANYTCYTNEDVIDSIHIVSKQIPDSIGAIVWNYLLRGSILNLPSQIAIPGFRDNTADGETYYIEIATSELYKQLRYHNPGSFNDRYNRQFSELIYFLRSRFKI